MGLLPTAHAQTPPKPPSTELTVSLRAEHLELGWRDAEDSVRGAIRPARPSTGEPIRISLRVGTFQGEPFTGPVTLSLRKVGAPDARERTVLFEEGAGWVAPFEVEAAGEYELDVGFRTTRLKTVRARFPVVDRTPVPRWLQWVAMGLIALSGLAFGVRMALRTTSPGTHSGPP